ncbi:proline-rich transmembrane protein 1-like isoform X2 [Pomacea canaliculata]|uniref:proline-rich transmembrane protein 1-like isoform X2 n=1 Tax=Pomacea canaliculata TaxID=400727 RepID=UPI000D728D47|nr:proline-rich transmembrane protein 1-like isoform X2 [Pomacea canaliculata]
MRQAHIRTSCSLFPAVFLSGNTSTSQMDENQALPPANNEATEGYPATGNPGFAGNSFGYPSSYPPQQGYGEGYAAQPGYQPTQQDYKSNQPTVVVTFQDHMCLAIFTTLCCFWPIGIFAIFRACEARKARATGYFELAQTLSRVSPLIPDWHRHWMHRNRHNYRRVFAVNKIAVNTANYYLSQLDHEAK